MAQGFVRGLCPSVVFLALVACGTTEIREQRVMQAVQENGEIAYYRLTIAGQASLAKTDYKSGLYDAEALDALQTGVLQGDAQSVDRTLERLRREAIAEVGADFYRTVRTSEVPAEVERARQRLATVLQSPWLLAQQNGSGELAVPRRKYAIIFSALASVVEEAIASFAEERDTIDTAIAAISGIRREQLLTVTAQTETLDAAERQLAVVESHAESLTADPQEPARLERSLRMLLEDVAAVRVR